MKAIASTFVLVWLMAIDLGSRTLAAEILGAIGGAVGVIPGIELEHLVRPSPAPPIWLTLAVALVVLLVLFQLSRTNRITEMLAGAGLLAGTIANLLEIFLNGKMTTFLSVGPEGAPILRFNLADIWIGGAVLLALGDTIFRLGSNSEANSPKAHD